MRVVFEVLDDVAYLCFALLEFRDADDHAQGDAALVCVKEASPAQTFRAVADKHVNGPVVALHLEALTDGFRRQFDDLFHARRHLARGKHLRQARLLGHDRIDAVRGDHHVGEHFVFTGPDADHFPVLHQQVVDANAAGQDGARLFGLRGEPVVKAGPQKGEGMIWGACPTSGPGN